MEYVDGNCVQKADMNFGRSDSSAVYDEIRDRIYVIGGSIPGGGEFLKSCEYYDVNSDKWIKIAELNHARGSASSCIFDSSFIYYF